MIDILYPFEEKKQLDELVYIFKNANGNIVLWLGSGISKMAGYPLWNELAYELIECYKRKHSDDIINKMLENFYQKGDFLRILETIKSKDESLYKKEIQRIFNANPHSEKDKSILYTIKKFMEKGVIVITTNIDMELQRTLNLDDEKISIVPTREIRPTPKLIYLHGRIDKPESWVLTESDYAKAYDNSPRYCGKFLDGFLNQYPLVVIIGYSLREREIYRKFLKTESKPKIFWIQLIEKSEREEELKYQISYFRDSLRFDIKPIFYKKDLTRLLEYIYNEAYRTTVWEAQ